MQQWRQRRCPLSHPARADAGNQDRCRCVGKICYMVRAATRVVFFQDQFPKFKQKNKQKKHPNTDDVGSSPSTLGCRNLSFCGNPKGVKPFQFWNFRPTIHSNCEMSVFFSGVVVVYTCNMRIRTYIISILHYLNIYLLYIHTHIYIYIYTRNSSTMQSENSS